MRKSTEITHARDYYENGRIEPTILVECIEGDSYISFICDTISSGIVNFDGHIPHSEQSPKYQTIKDLYVWQLSDSIEDPMDIIVREYNTIDVKTEYVDGETGIRDRLKEWYGGAFTDEQYTNILSNFLVETEDERDGYCSSLVTCSCGTREVYDSVSLAVANKNNNHNDCENTDIWYFCGLIDKEVKKLSYSHYESSRSQFLKILKKNKNDPIYTVPIHKTPLSIALQDVGAYSIENHNKIE